MEERNGIFIFEHRTCYYSNGLLHRLDGPAVVRSNGSKEWYKEGKLHRLDGPACEFFDGTKYWYFEGKLHRLDGAAIENPHSNKAFFINGKMYSKKEWKRISFAILNNLEVFI